MLLKRLLTPPLVILAAILVFIEDVLWVRLNALLAWFGRLPLIARIEGAISRLPAYAAMPLFLLPMGLLLPFKLAALWLLAHGRAMSGIAVFVIAKVAGTAIAARLFVLCRPALMSKEWFARAYNCVMALRLKIYAALHELRAYRIAKLLIRRARRTLRAFSGRRGGIKRRWRALARLRRMRTAVRP